MLSVRGELRSAEQFTRNSTWNDVAWLFSSPIRSASENSQRKILPQALFLVPDHRLKDLTLRPSTSVKIPYNNGPARTHTVEDMIDFLFNK